jgi:hypothetical protein
MRDMVVSRFIKINSQKFTLNWFHLSLQEPKDDLRLQRNKFPHIVVNTRQSLQFLHTPLPTPRNTMISLNYNTLNPFVTEKTKQEMKHLINNIS